MLSQYEKFKRLCVDKDFKQVSFGLLVKIVQEQVNKLGIDNLDSDIAIEAIKEITPTWDDSEFAFLISHSCYIPDHYPETGSEETLFSKLVEYLICEWGERLGYKSVLQKEKSTKEDITFFKGDSVIVCDAKSNRLGRSQKSPNVKDVMKVSEYKTWIEHYADKKKIGGFATFPSLMEWSKGSAIHTYLTDKSNPIMLVYNEYLAYMLLKKNKNPNLIFETLQCYPTLFPQKINDKSEAKKRYHGMITNQLKTLEDNNDFEVFLKKSKLIITEYVQYSIRRLEKIIKKNIVTAKQEITQISPSELSRRYVTLKAEFLNKEYNRILKNIIKFRTG